jgi:formate dehydrogenase iron-sulfur subunit
MTAVVYVPGDAGAQSLGANEVARAISAEAARRGTQVQLVRNGSRGAYWLEPLIEVAGPGGRLAYGPVGVADVAGLFEAGFLRGGAHALAHGRADSIPWLKNQQRLTFERVGLIDPSSVEDYVNHGGYQGLTRALQLAPAAIVEAITASGLRGRGGAAFPTGIKWKTVLDQAAAQKYITCNADEGDSGTFADRMLMEGDPLSLIEGMTIAGVAVGATQGFIYLRAEYPHAYAALNTAITAARQARYLGEDVLGSGKRFELEVRLGAGAYICGEETALFNSIEGKRGEPRNKPPFPAQAGLFGKPTLVNNVETLVNVLPILLGGGAAYARIGSEASTGTRLFSLSGAVARPGCYEVPHGTTLRALIELAGGVAGSGNLQAILLGGAAGVLLAPDALDLRLTFEDARSAGATLGSGVVMLFDDRANLERIVRRIARFFREESCGQCVPCRVGTVRQEEALESGNVTLLPEIARVMRDASICGLGATAASVVESARANLGLFAGSA